MIAEATQNIRRKIYLIIGKIIAPKVMANIEKWIITIPKQLDAVPRPSTLIVQRRLKRGLTVVEVGFGLGENALNLLEELNVGTLYCVDPYIGKAYVDGGEVVSRYVKKQSLKTQVEVFGNVVFISESSRTANMHFVDESVDFVYIDGAHNYASVLDDLRCWFPKVKVGGVIAGHDFNVGYGVPEAVSVFAQEIDIPFFVRFPDFWFIKIKRAKNNLPQENHEGNINQKNLNASRIRKPRKSKTGYCTVATRPTNEGPPAEDSQTTKQNGKN